MPIKVPNNLPAVETLTKENVFVMTDSRAMTQDIRPLKILILNLMPLKIETETQLTRLLGNTPIQVELELLQTTTHKASHTSQEHMIAFYKTFDEVKSRYYDGMIITGAPIEKLPFEKVDYWDELCEIMEWTKTHVHCTLHICWGAQAGLYYHYGIQKHMLPEKLSGVYKHHLDYKNGMLFRGFDDEFWVPHSRNTTVYREDIEAVPTLKVIASSEEAGVFAVKSENDRQIFIMGHSEYDGDTLKNEYFRDLKAGLDPKIPAHYFPDDDPEKEPIVRWRSCANLFYSNWLNYFVYQSTPYNIEQIHEEDLLQIDEQHFDLKVAKFGGSSLAGSDKFKNVRTIIEDDTARKYIVVSAPGTRKKGDRKITDILLECAESDGDLDTKFIPVVTRYREIIRGLGLKFDLDGEVSEIKRNFAGGAGHDYLVSRGEYLSAKIMAAYLGADFVDAAEIIKMDDDGNVLTEETYSAVRYVLKNSDRAVIPGFYGSTPDGEIRVFSRGGSDITGALVAAGVSAGIYENWTDVDGLLLADPRVVKNPLAVPVITYRELRELSLKGANVMHEDAVAPVKALGIPMNIRNTGNPDNPGTMIVQNADYYKSVLKVAGISGKTGYASIIVEKNCLGTDNEARKNVISVLESHGITALKFLTSNDSLNIIVRSAELKGIIREIKSEIKKASDADKVSVVSDLALVSVIGESLSGSPAIGVRVLSAVADKGINVRMLDQSPDGISMEVGLDENNYEEAIRAIYSEFTRK